LYKHIFKPIADTLFGIILLFALSPIILVTIILLFIANNGKIFFLQLRPGLYGKPFRIIKFRTMKDIFDDKGNLLSDIDRLTMIGKVIRSTSIDELLQLINVIKGEMSFVGPRPLLMQYLERYSTDQAKRHNVKPGITGWAQVNGRNAISWEEKFRLDLEYVKNQSFSLDLKILLMTIKNVLIRKGINSENNLTMEEFKGNRL
jgi:undecaprenyl phosphate N,N'-diacetylbacillosamine 1-phosphate transferase